MLLLDEPLSALDAHLVIRMQGVLTRLQRDLGITFVYVTHSQSEAFAMADRVVIMSEGPSCAGRPRLGTSTAPPPTASLPSSWGPTTSCRAA